VAGLRILAQEAEVEDAAVAEAAQAAQITLNEYNAGTVDYDATSIVSIGATFSHQSQIWSSDSSTTCAQQAQ
jgi:hypothetical protein